MPRMVKIYDWDEIQTAICEILGIEKRFFRDYHLVVGGRHKDLWNLFLDEVIPPYVANGRIIIMWRCLESCIEQMTGENEWKKDALLAWNKFYDENCPNDEGMIVEFTW